LSVTTELPEGWLTEEEAGALQSLATDRLVLEIGSWRGRSTVALARVAGHVVSVDHHLGSAEHERYEPSLPIFLANLESRGLRSKVSVCVMDSRHLGFFRPTSFDLVFVDGAHDFGSAVRDLRFAFRLVKTAGAVAVHDYRPKTTSEAGVVVSSFPQVVNAVNEVGPPVGWRVVEVVGDLAIMRLT
jgi:predicted O-methyltransferase YrrM